MRAETMRTCSLLGLFEIVLCGPGGKFRFRGGVNRIAAFEIPPPRFAQKLGAGAVFFLFDFSIAWLLPAA